MRKVYYAILCLIIISSVSFAQMKLQLPGEITGETSQSFLNHDLESNLRLDLPPEVTAPGGFGMLMEMWFVGLAFDLSFPLSEGFKDVWSTGISANAMLSYFIVRSLLLSFSVGYVSFSEKESYENWERCNYWIPIIIGASYIFNTRSRFLPFIGFALGLYLVNESWEYNNQKQEWNESKFGIAPRLGAYYMVTAAILISLTVQYNLVFHEYEEGGSNLSTFAIMLGFMYGLGGHSK